MWSSVCTGLLFLMLGITVALSLIAGLERLIVAPWERRLPSCSITAHTHTWRHTDVSHPSKKTKKRFLNTFFFTFQDVKSGHLNLGISGVFKLNKRYFMLLYAEWMLKSLYNLLPNLAQPL